MSPKDPMEPLDPQLRQVVHDGMVQAVPGPAVEERVLEGLLARLQVGPVEPEPSPEAEPVGVEAVGSAAASKTPLLVVLGGAALLAVAWAAGGRGDDEPRAHEVASGPADAPAPSRESARVEADEDATLEPEPAAAPEPAPVVSDGIEPPSLGEPSVPPGSSSAGAPPRRFGPHRGSSAAATDPKPTPAAADADALDAEVRLIAAAERALEAGDARAAVERTREHARQHPEGQLAVERRAIELAARCQLGEPGAEADAQAFLRRHGQAPAAATVRSRCSATAVDSSPRP